LRQYLGRAPFDDGMGELVALAETALTGVARPSTAESGLVVCPWFRVGDEVVRIIAVARFDPVVEVTLDDLRSELVYPLDAAADRFFAAVNTHRRPVDGPPMPPASVPRVSGRCRWKPWRSWTARWADRRSGTERGRGNR
jgi:hypothetical protein